jgi:hypothetical protein
VPHACGFCKGADFDFFLSSSQPHTPACRRRVSTSHLRRYSFAALPQPSGTSGCGSLGGRTLRSDTSPATKRLTPSFFASVRAVCGRVRRFFARNSWLRGNRRLRQHPERIRFLRRTAHRPPRFFEQCLLLLCGSSGHLAGGHQRRWRHSRRFRLLSLRRRTPHPLLLRQHLQIHRQRTRLRIRPRQLWGQVQFLSDG